MSGRKSLATVAGMTLAITLALLLSGCAYDYLQHTDRVGYSAGDAVKANLEGETINPSKRSMRDKSGLGKNGPVVPASGTTTTPSNGS
jgi:hypothetical protein